MECSDKCPILRVIKENSVCEKGYNRLNSKGVRGERLDEDRCPWHIDSEKHGYCFWVYMCDENNKKDRQLTEIAQLLNTSVNNIKLIEIGALAKIKHCLNHLNGIT